MKTENSGTGFTVQEAAELLGLHESTVYRHISGQLGYSRLPAKKIAGCIRIDPNDLEMWTESKLAA